MLGFVRVGRTFDGAIDLRLSIKELSHHLQVSIARGAAQRRPFTGHARLSRKPRAVRRIRTVLEQVRHDVCPRLIEMLVAVVPVVVVAACARATREDEHRRRVLEPYVRVHLLEDVCNRVHIRAFDRNLEAMERASLTEPPRPDGKV